MKNKFLIILVIIALSILLTYPLYDEKLEEKALGYILGTQTNLFLKITAILDKLEVKDINDPIQAGQLSNVTVSAVRQDGPVAADYRGTITLTSSDAHAQVLLPADYTFTEADAGIHTFADGVRLITAGEQSVTATDTSSINIYGSQENITVLPGPAAKITLSSDKSSLTANGSDQAILTAILEDQYGNKVADGTVVEFKIIAGGGSLSQTSVATVNGQAQITYTAGSVAGVATIEASSSGIKADIAITLTAGSANHLGVSDIKSPISAGEASDVKAKALDRYNNTDT